MNKPISPVDFINRVIKKNGKGQSWTLSPYQRGVLELALYTAATLAGESDASSSN